MSYVNEHDLEPRDSQRTTHWSNDWTLDVSPQYQLSRPSHGSSVMGQRGYGIISESLRWIKLRMWRHRKGVRVVLLLLALSFALWNWWMLGRVRPSGRYEDSESTDPASPLLRYMSKHLVVEYKVVSNIVSKHLYMGRITLRNSGTVPIPAGTGWHLYLNHLRFLEGTMWRESGSIPVANLQLLLTHVNGLLFRISPTPQFTGLEPGFALVYNFQAGGAVLNRYEVLPNWYVTGLGTEAHVLESTQDVTQFVQPFETAVQWKCSKVDRHDPYTPEKRYHLYEIEDMKRAPHLILPSPVQVTVLDKATLPLTHGWVVTSDERSTGKAQYLASKLKLKYASTAPRSHFIHLSLGTVDFSQLDKDELYLKEAYKLAVNHNEAKVTIQAKTEAGLFYGIQSFLSMMSDRSEIPAVEVTDAPRYQHRGLMLDVARHFLPAEEVIRVLDIMAMYKMNRLHLHLTDDDGWRLQIPGLPELTEVGGCRGHTVTERERLLAGYGSGPDGRNFSCGYYKVHEYKAILHHADQLHIKVVPEIDLPGHAHAAIKSMEARYAKLLRTGSSSQASTYLLSDLNDLSRYYSVQGWKDCVINPCLESTYTFVEHIMGALVNIHEDVQPLTGFHFGGDEIPREALTNSSVCQRLSKAYPALQKHSDYYAYFVKKLTALAKKYKLQLYGWQDAFYSWVGENLVPLTRDDSAEFVAMAWHTSWDRGRPHQPYELANNGYKVVLAPATIMYFDHPQEPDPEEIGLVWATRYSDTKKVFNFLPDNFYENIDYDFNGHPMDPDVSCQTTIKCPKLNHPQNIVGIEAALWTELIQNMDSLHHQLFPRLLALAERAWHKAPWESESDRKKMHFLRQEDWERFANTLGYKELSRLDEQGIAYFLPPPGAKYEQKQLKINTAFPGMDLVFRGHDGEEWKNLHSNAKIPAAVEIATKSFDGKRRSRPIRMDLMT